MLQKDFTVVKYIAPTKSNWNLTNNKEYAVETDTDFVDKEDYFLTVWNDEGKLAEMYDGEYEIVAVDKERWFQVRPNHIYIEMY